MGTSNPLTTLTRHQVLDFRWHAQQLHRPAAAGVTPTDAAILDLGIQDTGHDGASWALEVRGTPPAGPDDVAVVWSIRGAPHAYRRADLPAVAVATAPLSEADASKRIISANKPLREARIPALEALRTMAEHEREIVDEPTDKGSLSTQLTEVLPGPYLRFCRTCNATHSYEMTFRLATLQAGLELEPKTSPPVLTRIPGFKLIPYAKAGGDAEARYDVVRGYLRFFGPASQRDVAAYLDAPLADVKAHWPDDAGRVEVTGVDDTGRPQERWMLASDLKTAAAEPENGPVVRLLGPFDPYLQLRDREILVPDAARAKELWRTLGRPGAIVENGEVVGTWRPRASGKKLAVLTDPWAPFDAALRDAIEEEAERLRAFRGASSVMVTAA